ncbi:hypothetical protein ACFRMQ_28160 [Kitasatospora sp. NPDC056783]
MITATVSEQPQAAVVAFDSDVEAVDFDFLQQLDSEEIERPAVLCNIV